MKDRIINTAGRFLFAVTLLSGCAPPDAAIGTSGRGIVMEKSFREKGSDESSDCIWIQNQSGFRWVCGDFFLKLRRCAEIDRECTESTVRVPGATWENIQLLDNINVIE